MIVYERLTPIKRGNNNIYPADAKFTYHSDMIFNPDGEMRVVKIFFATKIIRGQIVEKRHYPRIVRVLPLGDSTNNFPHPGDKPVGEIQLRLGESFQEARHE
jgi:hypothetical protein